MMCITYTWLVEHGVDKAEASVLVEYGRRRDPGGPVAHWEIPCTDASAGWLAARPVSPDTLAQWSDALGFGPEYRATVEPHNAVYEKAAQAARDEHRRTVSHLGAGIWAGGDIHAAEQADEARRRARGILKDRLRTPAWMYHLDAAGEFLALCAEVIAEEQAENTTTRAATAAERRTL